MWRGVDVLRAGIDGTPELVDVTEVAQRLDSAGRGAGTNGDEDLRPFADLTDPLLILWRCDRPLDQGQVIWTGLRSGRCLEEVGDLTCPASVRSSSSQSRRVNWHPSHEANFHTARVGSPVIAQVPERVAAPCRS